MANTANRNYPKPVPEHFISNDVTVLQVAYDMIDADVAALLVAVAAKAGLVHAHVIADVSGLQTALNNKAALSHTHALASLSDVNTTGIADGMLLVWNSALGFLPATAASVLGEHTHEISDILLLQDALNAKANSGDITAALAAKADLASPNLTGNPTAPTQSAGDSSTKLANTAFVAGAVATGLSVLRNGVSSAFDTLAEIATDLASFGRYEVGDYCWSARTSKSKWIACDGTAVSRTTYAALFAQVGTRYGAGNGTTTFNLPSVSGRGMIGFGAGAGLTARNTQGATGGAETHVLAESEMPAHDHDVVLETINNGAATGSTDLVADKDNAGNDGADTVTTASAGGGAAHNNMQPFLVERCFIYTGV